MNQLPKQIQRLPVTVLQKLLIEGRIKTKKWEKYNIQT
jgi:hypothetical protein